MGVWQAALTLRQLGDADETPAKGCWVGVGERGMQLLNAALPCRRMLCNFLTRTNVLQPN